MSHIFALRDFFHNFLGISQGIRTNLWSVRHLDILDRSLGDNIKEVHEDGNDVETIKHKTSFIH